MDLLAILALVLALLGVAIAVAVPPEWQKLSVILVAGAVIVVAISLL